MARKYLLFAACLSVALLGCSCSQQTPAITQQPAMQTQNPVSDQAAQGSNSNISIYVINSPNRAQDEETGEGFLPEMASGVQPAIEGLSGDGSSTSLAKARGSRVQAGFVFNIHTGGSSTGQQATGSTGSQESSPNSTVTQTPTQRPEAAIDIPIAFGMPGSAPQASGSSSVEGSASTTASKQDDLRNLWHAALGGDQAAASQLLNFIAAFFGVEQAPTSQPVSQ